MMDMREILMQAMQAPAPSDDVTLDAADVLDAASSAHMTQSQRMHAASVVQQWVETDDDDLDDGETLSDRLYALLAAGVIDTESEDDLTEDEQDALDAVLAATEEYLLSFGVDADDVSSLLDEWGDDAAGRVRDALAEALPDPDAAMDSITSFAFDAEAAVVALDAAYRSVVSFKGGQRTVKRIRTSGRGRKMSAKQKAALRRARMRANTSQSKRRRAMSLKKRKKSVGMKRKYA